MNKHFILSTLNNRRGNALIGVVAAGVISGLIGMGTYAMISSQINAQKMVGASAEKTILRSQIQGLLASQNLCSTGLLDAAGKIAKFNPDNILPAKPTAPQIAAWKLENSIAKITFPGMVLTQDGMGSNGLHIVSHQLMEPSSSFRVNDKIGSLPVKRITAILKVFVERSSGKGPTGIPQSSLDFPIFVATDASSGTNKNNIVECSAAPTRSISSGGSAQWVPLECSSYSWWGASWNCVTKGNLSPGDFCKSKGFDRATGACKHDNVAPHWYGVSNFSGERSIAASTLLGGGGGKWGVSCMTTHWQIPDFIECAD